MVTENLVWENHFPDYLLQDRCLSRNKYQRLAFPFCVDVSGRLSAMGKLIDQSSISGTGNGKLILSSEICRLLAIIGKAGLLDDVADITTD